MIRKAKKSDFKQVFKLTMMASKLAFSDALNTTNEEKLKDLAFKFFNDENTKHSYKNTYVYETDNGIAGCMIYYDTNKEKMFNSVMEDYLETDYKFPIEGLENTFYLDTIAVFDEYQGQGIATKLIKYIIENENRDISLIAEDHKKYVVEYYKRLGFKIVSTSIVYGSKTNLMILENK